MTKLEDRALKLPRWVVVSLLTASLLVVLGAGALWWITWPERTAERFVGLLETYDLEQAKAMMGSKPSLTRRTSGGRPVFGLPVRWSNVKPQPRSWLDVVSCTRQFLTCEGDSVIFTAKMGRIQESPKAFIWWKLSKQRNESGEFSIAARELEQMQH